jgi:Spy/CpxP family protein refolding chaperone
MKRTITTLAAGMALAAGLTFAQTTAPAQPAQLGQAKHHVARGMRMGRIAQALNLTDAQKQQAKGIFQQAHQSAQPLVQQLKQNREALAAAVKADNSAQIQQLSATQGQLRGQMTAIRTEAMAKFYSTVLTPDQRTKLDQMHQNWKQRRAANNNT